MQDNSQRPHPFITPSLPPPPIHLPLLTTVHPFIFTFLHPLIPLYFFHLSFPLSSLSPPFSNQPQPQITRPFSNATILSLTAAPPLFSPPPVSSVCFHLLWIIPLIRLGACNTSVVYNMSVVITDSLAVLH